MKLIDFERHLKKYSCQKIREGGNHIVLQISLLTLSISLDAHLETFENRETLKIE